MTEGMIVCIQMRKMRFISLRAIAWKAIELFIINSKKFKVESILKYVDGKIFIGSSIIFNW